MRKATGAQGFATVTGIQDSHKVHTSGVSMRNATEARVRFLPNFPPRSPDLNPIENLFAILDMYLAKRYKEQGAADSEPAFMQRVDDFFALASTRDHIRSLLRSMPTRLQKCIDLDGYHTGY